MCHSKSPNVQALYAIYSLRSFLKPGSNPVKMPPTCPICSNRSGIACTDGFLRH